jgi:hypothetical protein
MRTRTWLVSLLFAVVSLPLGADVARALIICERFPLPASEDSWQRYSLLLQPDLWLIAPTSADIGALGGALASVAQIHSVLGSLDAAEIGGVCSNSTNGSGTIFPCGFRMDNPNLANLATDDFTSGTDEWRGTENRVVTSLSWASSGGNPGGVISIQPFGAGTTLSTFLASSAFLGNMDLALGQTLSFDFETISNPSAPPDAPISYSYGVAILSTGTVPEPPTDALIIGALVILG